ncbi:Uma2 family endonuclease [Thermostichus vulcanus]|uniref:Uma2 family endonuclease n=1 Tax=Thermostichus vulcanus str. 'Rupite' TaxID=2813851 RepID=A0ABT0CBR6_THEVL|nr:Uma2 family endonuclease [Thermostichus vulcanus]MCJ2543232.1 Uma2 family endonuclease [Thermostichus vulcanus str. 'Rupite']
MVQTPAQPLTVEEYLAIQNGSYEGRVEVEDGYIREMPTEDRINTRIAFALSLRLAQILPPAQLSVGHVEVEIPSAKAQFRNPDVMVLDPAHVHLLGDGRGTIRLHMPPPLLVVEVVSPGKENEQRDYQDKRKEYAARGIPEYWIVDPQRQSILLLRWADGQYQEEEKTGSQLIVSTILPQLHLTAEQILKAEP